MSSTGRPAESPLLFRWRSALSSEQGPGPTARLVLLTLSMHADANGGSLFPSTRTLATETGLTRQTVMRYLTDAEKDGWISRSLIGQGRGWRRASYRLNIPERGQASLTPSADNVVTGVDHLTGERGQPGQRRGKPGLPNVVNQDDLNSSVNSSKNSSKKTASASPDENDVTPELIAKEQARRDDLFKQARKRRLDKVTPATTRVEAVQ